MSRCHMKFTDFYLKMKTFRNLTLCFIYFIFLSFYSRVFIIKNKEKSEKGTVHILIQCLDMLNFFSTWPCDAGYYQLWSISTLLQLSSIKYKLYAKPSPDINLYQSAIRPTLIVVLLCPFVIETCTCGLCNFIQYLLKTIFFSDFFSHCIFAQLFAKEYTSSTTNGVKGVRIYRLYVLFHFKWI